MPNFKVCKRKSKRTHLRKDCCEHIEKAYTLGCCVDISKSINNTWDRNHRNRHSFFFSTSFILIRVMEDLNLFSGRYEERIHPGCTASESKGSMKHIHSHLLLIWCCQPEHKKKKKKKSSHKHLHLSYLADTIIQTDILKRLNKKNKKKWQHECNPVFQAPYTTLKILLFFSNLFLFKFEQVRIRYFFNFHPRPVSNRFFFFFFNNFS